MKIGVASDHRGFDLKEKIKAYLIKKGYEVIDYGTDSHLGVDFNDYSIKVCKGILNNEIEKGVLICGTGIGMSIAANKVKGIMCAKVTNSSEARLCVQHNNVNIIALSSKEPIFKVKDILDAYLTAKYLNEEKYNRRIDKIKDLEKKRKY